MADTSRGSSAKSAEESAVPLFGGVRIKQEKITPPSSPQRGDSHVSNADGAGAIATIDDKSSIGPVKSSKEILGELFQTFSAVVPDELISDEQQQQPQQSSGKGTGKHKKHKKEKKHKKSKHRERDAEADDASDVAGAQAPDFDADTDRRAARKIKKEKRDKEPKADRASTEKREKRARIGYPGDEDDRAAAAAGVSHKRIKREKLSPARDATSNAHSKPHGSSVFSASAGGSASAAVPGSVGILGAKPRIVIKSLKESAVLRDADSRIAAEADRRHRPSSAHADDHYRGRTDHRGGEQHREQRHYSRGDHRHGEDGELSLSDEETYEREKEARYYGDERRSTVTTRHHQNRRRRSGDSRERSSRDRDHHRDHHHRGAGGGRDRRDERSERSSDQRHERRSADRSGGRSGGFYGSEHERRSHGGSPNNHTGGERIDKKRLLEVARKNAIQMLESGRLPGAQNISAEAREKVLAKMRYGGKTVDELTEFCKKLSSGEAGNGCLSSDNDDDDDDASGSDAERERAAREKERAFNHPFVLRDKAPIVMNIRNSVAIQPKTAEQTKAILMQYPVSSGQHHRLNESEWVPVTDAAKKAAAAAAASSAAAPVPKPVPPPAVPAAATRSPANPATGQLEQQVQDYQQQLGKYAEQRKDQQDQTTPKPVPAPVPAPSDHTPTGKLEQQLRDYQQQQEKQQQQQQPPQQQPLQQQTALLQNPGTVHHNPFKQHSPHVSDSNADATQSSTNIFANSTSQSNLDVTSIISQRLNAMRKLQENPHDVEAIKKLHSAQKDMSSWANSKFVPGQFTGSTGATILSSRELTSGFQAWAKRNDQNSPQQQQLPPQQPQQQQQQQPPQRYQHYSPRPPHQHPVDDRHHRQQQQPNQPHMEQLPPIHQYHNNNPSMPTIRTSSPPPQAPPPRPYHQIDAAKQPPFRNSTPQAPFHRQRQPQQRQGSRSPSQSLSDWAPSTSEDDDDANATDGNGNTRQQRRTARKFAAATNRRSNASANVKPDPTAPAIAERDGPEPVQVTEQTVANRLAQYRRATDHAAAAAEPPADGAPVDRHYLAAHPRKALPKNCINFVRALPPAASPADGSQTSTGKPSRFAPPMDRIEGTITVANPMAGRTHRRPMAKGAANTNNPFANRNPNNHIKAIASGPQPTAGSPAESANPRNPFAGVSSQSVPMPPAALLPGVLLPPPNLIAGPPFADANMTRAPPLASQMVIHPPTAQSQCDFNDSSSNKRGPNPFRASAPTCDNAPGFEGPPSFNGPPPPVDSLRAPIRMQPPPPIRFDHPIVEPQQQQQLQQHQWHRNDEASGDGGLMQAMNAMRRPPMMHSNGNNMPLRGAPFGGPGGYGDDGGGPSSQVAGPRGDGFGGPMQRFSRRGGTNGRQQRHNNSFQRNNHHNHSDNNRLSRMDFGGDDNFADDIDPDAYLQPHHGQFDGGNNAAADGGGGDGNFCEDFNFGNRNDGGFGDNDGGDSYGFSNGIDYGGNFNSATDNNSNCNNGRAFRNDNDGIENDDDFAGGPHRAELERMAVQQLVVAFQQHSNAFAMASNNNGGGMSTQAQPLTTPPLQQQQSGGRGENPAGWWTPEIHELANRRENMRTGLHDARQRNDAVYVANFERLDTQFRRATRGGKRPSVRQNHRGGGGGGGVGRAGGRGAGGRGRRGGRGNGPAIIQGNANEEQPTEPDEDEFDDNCI